MHLLTLKEFLAGINETRIRKDNSIKAEIVDLFLKVQSPGLSSLYVLHYLVIH